MCGVSSGWIKEEYDLAHADFASRGRRLDDLIAAMRVLWTGKVVSHRGEFFNFDAIMCPAPKQPIPIVCGGGAKAAMRRAALNDGWLPLPMPLTEMKVAAAEARAVRRQAGIDADNFKIYYAQGEPVTPSVEKGLEDIGIEDVIVIGPWIKSPWDIENWTDEGDNFHNDLSSRKRRWNVSRARSLPDKGKDLAPGRHGCESWLSASR